MLLNQKLVIITPNGPNVDNPITLEPLGGGRFRYIAPTGGGVVGEVVRFVEQPGRADADVHRRQLDRSRTVAHGEGEQHGAFTQATPVRGVGRLDRIAAWLQFPERPTCAIVTPAACSCRRESDHRRFHRGADSQAVGTARVGRKLTPKSWPNGARVAVCLSFDVDNELLQRANPLPVPLSVGEYGATTSVPRILDLLDRHQVPATFFIPAMGIMLHPEMVPAILARRRHEIGVHGWVHEFWPGIGDTAKEQRLLAQSIEYLTKATGKRPVGVRAPSWDSGRRPSI